jgi:uncharacterized protein
MPPSSVPSRQQFPDELRGLALLGIVLVNVPFLGMSMMGFTRTLVDPWWDRIAEFLVIALFQAKFYLLFSFLFGYSAHLILNKGDSNARFVMRLLGLALLGATHAIFFFVGDILLSYAVLGIFLVFAWRWSDKALLKASQIAALVSLAWMAFVGYLALQPGFDDSEVSDIFRRSDSLIKVGNFWQAAQARIQVWPIVLWVLGSLNWGLVLSCFCLGMLAGRKGLLAQPEIHPEIWRACRRAGWIGLPFSLLSAWLTAGPGSQVGLASDPRSLMGVLLGFCAAPFLSAAYVGWMVKLRSLKPQAFGIFRSAGRMSLSLYIGESVLLALYFCGWGAGYFGALGSLKVMVIAIVAWGCLELIAFLWLRRFAQGPLEFVLKEWCGLIGKCQRQFRT